MVRRDGTTPKGTSDPLRQTPRRGRARFRLQTDDAGDYVRVGNGTFRLGTGVRDRSRASCRAKGRRASRQAGTRRGGARRAKTKKPPEYPAVRERGELKTGRDGGDLGRSENGRHREYPCNERNSISSFIGESPFWVDTIAGSEPHRRVRTINGPGFRPTAVFGPSVRKRRRTRVFSERTAKKKLNQLKKLKIIYL